jgi:hypothetical protein
MEKILEEVFIPTFIAFRRGQAIPRRAKDSSGSSERVLCYEKEVSTLNTGFKHREEMYNSVTTGYVVLQVYVVWVSHFEISFLKNWKRKCIFEKRKRSSKQSVLRMEYISALRGTRWPLNECTLMGLNA